MKERFSSSSGFVSLEALFSLMLAVIALSSFAFYLSLPKLPTANQIFLYPSKILSTQEVTFQSSSLTFKAKRLRMEEGKNIYTAFEAF